MSFIMFLFKCLFFIFSILIFMFIIPFCILIFIFICFIHIFHTLYFFGILFSFIIFIFLRVFISSIFFIFIFILVCIIFILRIKDGFFGLHHLPLYLHHLHLEVQSITQERSADTAQGQFICDLQSLFLRHHKFLFVRRAQIYRNGKALDWCLKS